MFSNTAQEPLLLHSYKRSFNGFAAKLTEEEAQKMAGCGSSFLSNLHKKY